MITIYMWFTGLLGLYGLYGTLSLLDFYGIIWSSRFSRIFWLSSNSIMALYYFCTSYAESSYFGMRFAIISARRTPSFISHAPWAGCSHVFYTPFNESSRVPGHLIYVRCTRDVAHRSIHLSLICLRLSRYTPSKCPYPHACEMRSLEACFTGLILLVS